GRREAQLGLPCLLRPPGLYERQHRCSHSRVGALTGPRSFCLSGPPRGSPNRRNAVAFDLTEKRYVKETGLEQRIARIVEPVANDLGYALVRVKITQENGCTLQVMAEDANGRFAITDCERLSKELSPVLDVEDPIDREY